MVSLSLHAQPHVHSALLLSLTDAELLEVIWACWLGVEAKLICIHIMWSSTRVFESSLWPSFGQTEFLSMLLCVQDVGIFGLQCHGSPSGYAMYIPKALVASQLPTTPLPTTLSVTFKDVGLPGETK
jgi:hypothetical protein